MISRLLSKPTLIARSLIDDLREFISPSACVGCGNDIDPSSSFLCADCKSSLIKLNPGQGPVCPFCGRPDGTAGSCVRCSAAGSLRLYFWGIYDGLLKESITRFKFDGLHKLGKELTELSADALISRLSSRGYDLIVPVPLYGSRRREREFNQSEIIASVLAERIGIEMNTEMIIRSRSTFQQAKLEKSRRWENVKNAFAVTGDIDLSNRKILLVDDIITTGATIFEASRPLLACGATEIEIFSLAYAV